MRLNDAPSSASSAGPPSGARALRSPAANRCEALRIVSRGLTRLRARRKAPSKPIDVTAPVMKMKSASSPIWNMTRPETSTAPRGRITATSARPMSWRRTDRSVRKRNAASVPTRIAPIPTAVPSVCHGSNRYPTPQMVLMIWGSEGSSSIFSLSRRTWTVTVLVPASSAAS